MNKEEFEILSGLSVSDETYKKIEILYENSKLDKHSFVEEWLAHRRNKVMNALASMYVELDKDESYFRKYSEKLQKIVSRLALFKKEICEFYKTFI